jgi:hypothetical protein
VAAGFLQHGLGVERRRARRELATAALLDPERPLLRNLAHRTAA